MRKPFACKEFASELKVWASEQGMGGVLWRINLRLRKSAYKARLRQLDYRKGKAMKLTANDLVKAKACRSQIDLFREHFGDGGTVTLAKVRKVAHLFDWGWAAQHLLSEASYAEYERATASASAEYQRAKASASAEYERAKASVWAEYERATASAWFAGWKKDHARRG